MSHASSWSITLGAVLALTGCGLAATGTGLATSVDDHDWYISSAHPLTSTTAAIAGDVDLLLSQQPDDAGGVRFADDVGDVAIRLEATGAAGGELFLGIARKSDLDRYLAGSAHERLSEMRISPFEVNGQVLRGERELAEPATEDFWLASTSGAGRQQLDWVAQPGDYEFVVMNADASPVLEAESVVGVRLPLLRPAGIGVGALGALLVIGGAAAVAWGIRSRRRQPAAANT
jgi:hypothetical protein